MGFARRIGLLLGVLFGCLPWIDARQPDAGPIISRVESPQMPNRGGCDSYSLRSMMEQFGVPGVSVAVISDFKVHWAKAYGIADVLTGAPVDTDTLFQAASISKAVAAMAVLRAVQDGKFSIDADINKILNSWKVPGSRWTVTPRSLLSHTSGADDGFGFPGYLPDAPLPTVVQILNGGKPSNTPPVLFTRPPGAVYKYSGGGVTIMQLAMMDAYGSPYAGLLQQLVLQPVGMVRSSFDQPLSPERDRNAARAHNYMGRAMGAKWHVYPELAAAGLWTTPSDLARFAIEIQLSVQGKSNKVLSRKMARGMITPVGVGPYACGLSIERRGKGRYFSHGGANWGFRAHMTAHLSKGYGAVIMTNGDQGSVLIEELLGRIASAYNWDSLHKPMPR